MRHIFRRIIFVLSLYSISIYILISLNPYIFLYRPTHCTHCIILIQIIYYLCIEVGSMQLDDMIFKLREYVKLHGKMFSGFLDSLKCLCL